jgi:hypothetical protein
MFTVSKFLLKIQNKFRFRKFHNMTTTKFCIVFSALEEKEWQYHNAYVDMPNVYRSALKHARAYAEWQYNRCWGA